RRKVVDSADPGPATTRLMTCISGRAVEIPRPCLRSRQSPDEQFGERARGSGVLPCEQVVVHDRVRLPGRTPRILGGQLLQLVLQQPLGSVGEPDAGLLLVAETRHTVVREGRAA